MNDKKIEEIKNHIEAISEILGIEKTESNADTPLRVAKMYCNELFKNRNNENIEELNSRMKLFPCDPHIKQLPITVKGIKFNSVCEHHWLPFMGVAEISYKPSNKIIGLSKIPRVVKYFSQKPQLQENLTNEIGEYLFELLQPVWVKVRLTATHTCVMCRGAESDCETETSYFKHKGDCMYGDEFYATPTELHSAFGIPASDLNGGVTPV